MHIDEISRSVIDVSTVVFLLIDELDNPRPLGSGVFAKCGSINGILTCGHVANELPTDRIFGIAPFGERDGFDTRAIISGSSTVADAIVEYTPPGCRSGPDLAFIPMPEDKFAKLTPIVSVIDLDEEYKKALRVMSDDAKPYEAVAGFVDVLTDPATTSGTKKTIEINGLVNVGKLDGYENNRPWDLVAFRPEPDSYSSNPPSSFDGTSGGGMWRLYVSEKASGEFDLIEARLVGIAFWEEYENGALKIIGHGVKSIYQEMRSRIHSRWPP